MSKEISDVKIMQRAYEIFESRGAEQGKDLDDWLQAEKEISQIKETDKNTTATTRIRKKI